MWASSQDDGYNNSMSSVVHDEPTYENVEQVIRTEEASSLMPPPPPIPAPRHIDHTYESLDRIDAAKRKGMTSIVGCVNEPSSYFTDLPARETLQFPFITLDASECTPSRAGIGFTNPAMTAFAREQDLYKYSNRVYIGVKLNPKFGLWMKKNHMYLEFVKLDKVCKFWEVAPTIVTHDFEGEIYVNIVMNENKIADDYGVSVVFPIAKIFLKKNHWAEAAAAGWEVEYASNEFPSAKDMTPLSSLTKQIQGNVGSVAKGITNNVGNVAKGIFKKIKI